MIFKLKCKTCGNIIFYDTDANHDIYQKCSNCGEAVNMRIEEKLNGVLELESFEFLGVERDFSGKVLGEDFSGIERIYDRADTAKQKSVANIIDKIYLILHRNNESFVTLEKMLTDYFNSSH